MEQAELYLVLILQVKERNKSSDIPLHLAARIGHEEMVQILLVNAPVNTIGRSILIIFS